MKISRGHVGSRPQLDQPPEGDRPWPEWQYLFCSVLFCSELTAQFQGSWDPPFNHRNLNGVAGEVEQPPVARADWITLDTIAGRDLTMPLPLDEKFNSIHCCLIPYGPQRGNVLVIDGNQRNYCIPGPGQPLQRIRDKQPWSIVNPYWPAVHPYTNAVGNRFYNRVLTLPRDPVTNANLGELFCAGQAWMPDGRLFLAGGTMRYPTQLTGGDFLGSRLTWFFDPQSVAWIRGPDLAVARWYPTVIYDGNYPTTRALVLGGTDPGGVGVLDHYESLQTSYNTNPPSAIPDSRTIPGVYANLRLYAGLPGTHANAPMPRDFSDYPRAHLLTDGTFFISGFEAPGAVFQHNPLQDPTYDMNRGLMPSTSPDYMVHYPTCLYAANNSGTFNHILRLGGIRTWWTGTQDNSGPSNQVEACDASLTAGVWTTGGLPNMYWDREHFNVVYLPGGELLAIGGLSFNAQFQTFIPNVQPELLVNNSFWTPVAGQTGVRHYHSCALLLPDGRVFVGGGEGHNGGPRPDDYQIYNPPYITLGLPRPDSVLVRTLGGATVNQDLHGAFAYGGTYTVSWNGVALPAGVDVEKVVLIRPSALTHHDDGGQRYFRLPATAIDGVRYTRQFTLTSNPYELPRGWYMLFLVTNQGAPSDKAYWVNVR